MNPRDQAPPTPQQQALVLWVIWFSILSGIVIIQMFAGGGWPSGDDKSSFTDPIFLAAMGSFLNSVAVRLFVLPKQSAPEKQLPVAIIGMALAEGAMILGTFVLPKDAVSAKQSLIVLAFLGVAAYAPFYVGKKPGNRHGFSGGDDGYQR